MSRKSFGTYHDLDLSDFALLSEGSSGAWSGFNFLAAWHEAGHSQAPSRGHSQGTLSSIVRARIRHAHKQPKTAPRGLSFTLSVFVMLHVSLPRLASSLCLEHPKQPI